MKIYKLNTSKAMKSIILTLTINLTWKMRMYCQVSGSLRLLGDEVTVHLFSLSQAVCPFWECTSFFQNPSLFFLH